MKRWISICLTIALLVCVCGCGVGKKEIPDQTPLGENMIHLYCVNEDTIVQSEEAYQLKTPDSASASVDDVMTALLDKENSQIESYSYMMGEDNSLILELFVGEAALEKENTLLMMAAITKTLFQLQDIQTIQLTVSQNSGDVVGTHTYTRDSFYFYDYDNSLANITIQVFVPAETGEKLQAVVVEKTVMPDVSEQEMIVRELVARGIIAKQTHVNMVSVHDGICYLDLSEEFIKGEISVRADVSLYALINSIVKQCGVDAVQILVDGERIDIYKGRINILEPLTYNSELE